MQEFLYSICPKCGEIESHVEGNSTEKQTTPVEVACYLTESQEQQLKNLLSIWNEEKQGWCAIKVDLLTDTELTIYLIVMQTVEEIKNEPDVTEYVKEEIRRRINQWLQTREGWRAASEEFNGFGVSWSDIKSCPLDELMMPTNSSLTYGIYNRLEGIQIDVDGDEKISYDNVPATLKILKTNGTTETQDVIANLADNSFIMDKKLDEDDETIEEISVVFQNGEEIECKFYPSGELYIGDGTR